MNLTKHMTEKTKILPEPNHFLNYSNSINLRFILVRKAGLKKKRSGLTCLLGKPQCGEQLIVLVSAVFHACGVGLSTAVLHTFVQPGCQEQQIGAADKPKRRQSLGTGLREEPSGIQCLAADLKLFSSLLPSKGHTEFFLYNHSYKCVMYFHITARRWSAKKISKSGIILVLE